MTPKLQKGRALVLVGPQGCGKTTLAREIAAKAGKFTEIRLADLESPFQEWMLDKAETYIVEGLLSKRTLDRLRHFISSRFATVNLKGREAQQRDTPNLIFCSNSIKASDFEAADRRYVIFEVGA